MQTSHFVGGFDPDARFPDSPKGICDFALGPLEAGPANHFFVLGIDFAADAKPSSSPRKSHQQDLGWQSLRLKQTGNQNIPVGQPGSLVRGLTLTTCPSCGGDFRVDVLHRKLIDPLPLSTLP